MKRLILDPILHRDGYAVLLEHEVLSYFDETLFYPLRELIGLRHNAAPDTRQHSAVWDAILSGALWYASGIFFGSFNALISRELRAMGARKIAGGFSLPQDEVPIALRGAIATAAVKNVQLHRSVISTLAQIEEHVKTAPTGVHMERVVRPIAEDLQKQLVSTVHEVKVPALPPGLPKQLAEHVSEETNEAVKAFVQESSSRLRQLAEENLKAGGTGDRLEKIIQTEMGIAKRKAHVIAEAETSRVVSDFRQNRYTALGMSRYRWDTSHDEKVRPTHGESNNHRVLDRREFAWDSPPIVDSATGRRCHPGQDYGPCRCVARPVLVIP